jgi:hypothetical protein
MMEYLLAVLLMERTRWLSFGCCGVDCGVDGNCSEFSC